MSYDAIVIGGGIGGLASAALLAVRGQRVLLCEATDRLGGFQRSFDIDGFRFEPNFHFLQDAAPGRPVRQLLGALGIEHQFRRADPVARLYYPDRTIDIPNDRAAFITELKRDFPHEANNIDTFFALMQELYIALSRQQPSALIAKYAADTMHAFVARFVSDEKLRAIAGAWAAYFGYGSDCITALGVIVFTEACWDGGIHQPVGGITSIIDKLRATIEGQGGEIRLKTSIGNILTRDGCVCGVRLADGGIEEAKLVFSSADTLTTLRDMVDDKSLGVAASMPFQKLERFRSPFAVYLGVRSDRLDLDIGPAVRIAFDGYDLAAQDVAQLTGAIEHAPLPMGIPTRVNPELAPPGYGIVILYTFLPNADIDGLLNNATRAREFAQRMVKRAEQAIPDLGANVVVIETSATQTPMLYNLNTKGALGWSPDPQTLPLMPDFSSSIPGLYLCGQWTRTGGGLNNVFASASLACAAALA